MRLLGIDFGTVRVGLATCDELQIVVTPHSVLPYSGAIFDHLASLVEAERIDGVVVGVPRTRDGAENLIVRQARNFAEKLRTRLPCAVHEWDESLSSKRAFERMIEAGVRRGRRRERGTTDAWAAAVILEDYLENERLQRSSLR